MYIQRIEEHERGLTIIGQALVALREHVLVRGVVMLTRSSLNVHMICAAYEDANHWEKGVLWHRVWTHYTCIDEETIHCGGGRLLATVAVTPQLKPHNQPYLESKCRKNLPCRCITYRPRRKTIRCAYLLTRESNVCAA